MGKKKIRSMQGFILVFISLFFLSPFYSLFIKMGLPTNNEQETAYLKEALLAVKVQSRLMKLCLVKYSNKNEMTKKNNKKKEGFIKLTIILFFC